MGNTETKHCTKPHREGLKVLPRPTTNEHNANDSEHKDEGKDARTVSSGKDTVATTKGILEGEEVSKKEEVSKDTSVPFTIYRRNVEPIPSINIGPKRVPKRVAKKKVTIAKGTALSNYAGKYNVLMELAPAPCGMNFGRLIRGS